MVPAFVLLEIILPYLLKVVVEISMISLVISTREINWCGDGKYSLGALMPGSMNTSWTLGVRQENV